MADLQVSKHERFNFTDLDALLARASELGITLPCSRDIGVLLEPMPLARLRDPAIFRVEDWTHKGRKIPVCFYTVDEHEIWGLTADILRQFLDHTG